MWICFSLTDNSNKCNLVQHVRLYCKVNICECLQIPRLYLTWKQQLQNKHITTQTCSSIHFSSNMLSMVRRSTAGNSSDHRATSNPDGEVCLETVLFGSCSPADPIHPRLAMQPNFNSYNCLYLISHYTIRCHGHLFYVSGTDIFILPQRPQVGSGAHLAFYPLRTEGVPR
jgi:hypothetical protein